VASSTFCDKVSYYTQARLARISPPKLVHVTNFVSSQGLISSQDDIKFHFALEFGGKPTKLSCEISGLVAVEARLSESPG
jgi:hypothetical protein